MSGSSGYPSIRAAAPLGVVVLLAVGCSTSEPPSTPTITTAWVAETATVSRVSDGDTLRTTAGRKIRLVQIDAPELHGDCFGKGALAALRKLISIDDGRVKREMSWVYADLGQLYERADSSASAVRMYEKYVQANPEDSLSAVLGKKIKTLSARSSRTSKR